MMANKSLLCRQTVCSTMGNTSPRSTSSRYDSNDEVRKRARIQAEIRNAENRMTQVLQYYETRKPHERYTDHGKFTTIKYAVNCRTPHDISFGNIRLPAFNDLITQLIFFGGVAASMELSNYGMKFKRSMRKACVPCASVLSRDLYKIDVHKAMSKIPLRLRPYFAVAVAAPLAGFGALSASLYVGDNNRSQGVMFADTSKSKRS